MPLWPSAENQMVPKTKKKDLVLLKKKKKSQNFKRFYTQSKVIIEIILKDVIKA